METKYTGCQLKPHHGARVLKIPGNFLWLDEDGILCSVSKNCPRTIENVQRIFNLARKLTFGKKVCFMSDVSEAQPYTKEARDYFAGQMSKIFVAAAIISTSPMGLMIANTLFRGKSGKFPFRICHDVDEARNWLRKYSARKTEH